MNVELYEKMMHHLTICLEQKKMLTVSVPYLKSLVNHVEKHRLEKAPHSQILRLKPWAVIDDKSYGVNPNEIRLSTVTFDTDTVTAFSTYGQNTFEIIDGMWIKGMSFRCQGRNPLGYVEAFIKKNSISVTERILHSDKPLYVLNYSSSIEHGSFCQVESWRGAIGERGYRHNEIKLFQRLGSRSDGLPIIAKAAQSFELNFAEDDVKILGVFRSFEDAEYAKGLYNAEMVYRLRKSRPAKEVDAEQYNYLLNYTPTFQYKDTLQANQYVTEVEMASPIVKLGDHRVVFYKHNHFQYGIAPVDAKGDHITGLYLKSPLI